MAQLSEMPHTAAPLGLFSSSSCGGNLVGCSRDLSSVGAQRARSRFASRGQLRRKSFEPVNVIMCDVKERSGSLSANSFNTIPSTILSEAGSDLDSGFPTIQEKTSLDCENRSNLRLLTFSQFDYSDDELEELAVRMLIEFYPLEESKFQYLVYRNLVGKIRAAYNDYPYHSFRHAFDVTQAMYVLLLDENLRALFRRVECLSLLLTCLLHDVGHNGKTNDVLKRCKDDLFAEFGESSPMEQYHVATAHKILETHPINNVLLENGQSFLNVMDELILFTDIERHAEFVQLLEADYAHDPNFQTLHDFKNDGTAYPSPRIRFLALLVKIADLSNLTREKDDADCWGTRLMRENAQLYKYCQSIGLEPNIPQTLPTEKEQAVSGVQFAQIFVKPLLGYLRRICPSAVMPFDIGLRRNILRWQELS